MDNYLAQRKANVDSEPFQVDPSCTLSQNIATIWIICPLTSTLVSNAHFPHFPVASWSFRGSRASTFTASPRSAGPHRYADARAVCRTRRSRRWRPPLRPMGAPHWHAESHTVTCTIFLEITIYVYCIYVIICICIDNGTCNTMWAPKFQYFFQVDGAVQEFGKPWSWMGNLGCWSVDIWTSTEPVALAGTDVQ